MTSHSGSGFSFQAALSKPTCTHQQYLKDKRCCSKCEPGNYMFAECVGPTDTKCRSCGSDEYQPDWTNETKCLPQKFCDTGKGFNRERPNNPRAAVPCQCKPGLQCSPINCEFCEKIPTCEPGFGMEKNSESGRRTCVPCKKGYFSPNTSMEPCNQWTSCKGLGKSEKQPGSDRTDAVCGPLLPGPSSSWLLVCVLSVITLLCLIILLLFCYKDKLKILSVNLRSCVQSLKRTRIQQDTLAPLYHSGGLEREVAGENCTLCETTCLIGPAHTHSETPRTCPSAAPIDRVELPPTKETEEERRREEEDEGMGSEGSGEVEEVSEGVSPLWAGSCVCVMSVREPLEVGENEDCSQAVSPGALGTCSCGGEGEGRDAEREDKKDGGRGERAKVVESLQGKSFERSCDSSSPTSSPSSLVLPAMPSCDLYLPLTQTIDTSAGKGEELYRLNCSVSPTPITEATPTSTPSSFSDTSVTPVIVGDGRSDLSSGALGSVTDQGLSWRDCGGNKLASGGSVLECSPESLQSQLTEQALTSGQVTGNNNTTFISSGQVMNFSADVIVVYVSQTSLGNEGEGPEDEFGSPVQEQANERAPPFPSSTSSKSAGHSPPPSPGNSFTHNRLRQDDNLPVQEVTDEWPREK
uniref:TNFR-Cys domain-containing protein n=1 Tax=Esox lucius TaxID=8010 RepID=A0A3P8ZUY6_ESOLU